MSGSAIAHRPLNYNPVRARISLFMFHVSCVGGMEVQYRKRWVRENILGKKHKDVCGRLRMLREWSKFRSKIANLRRKIGVGRGSEKTPFTCDLRPTRTSHWEKIKDENLTRCVSILNEIWTTKKYLLPKFSNNHSSVFCISNNKSPSWSL